MDEVTSKIFPPEEAAAFGGRALTHLRLLFALRKLRLRIGYQDGLWDLWDDRLRRHRLSDDENAQGLAKLKEKRWSIYLARAVYRYHAWWAAMGPRPLTEEDTLSTTDHRYARYTHMNMPKEWSNGNMLPLDVLMIWHTHMLNPRLYLEDTMRDGRGDIWSSGLPWDVLEGCLTDQFDYEVPEASRTAWMSATGLAWDNVEDPMHIDVTCPCCRMQMRFPWTTCDFQYDVPDTVAASASASASASTSQPVKGETVDKTLRLQERLNLIGHGLADGKPLQTCGSCRKEVDVDLLCFYKFVEDGHSLSLYNHCMPGTLLDPISGKPELHSDINNSFSISKANAALTAPNRLTREILHPKASEMLGKYRDGDGDRPTMARLRSMARRELHEYLALAIMAGEQQGKTTWDLGVKLAGYMLGRFPDEEDRRKATFKMVSSRVGVVLRRMLSQYVDNWSPFALDLRAAVLRQGLFIDKMYRFDWLHGVDPQATISRAVTKYARFLVIAANSTRRMVVPTLDVDLAWHTHQLSPQAYYQTSVKFIGKYLDHDDKVAEGKLSEAFEWMCEAYYKRYGELYSECICWFCEVTRASQTNTLSVMLGRSKRQKSFKDLRDRLGDADMGPHLSAHNAVKTPFPVRVHQPTRDLYVQHVERRKRGIRRAESLARKHEHGPPSKEHHVDHWGYPYALAGPWVCPLFFDQTMYTSSLSSPPPGSGINADDNIGGCATGCGSLTRCSSVMLDDHGYPMKMMDAGGIIADVHDVLPSYGGGDGGDDGGCGGCGGD